MSSVIVETLPHQKKENLEINRWPIWEKEVSRFDWYYDADEQCLILEGEVTVETDEGNFYLKAGDFVTFKKGLKCVWNVKEPVHKFYRFL